MDVTGPDEEEYSVEVKREYEADEDILEPESVFYVEKSSDLIYEVRFFTEFALVRPAHPHFTANLMRMDLITFAEQFDEFHGDAQVIKDFLWGGAIESIEVKKKS